MELKQIKRSKLSEALNAAKEQFKVNAFFTTSIRATKDGSLQVEVCQNRRLGGRKMTMLGMLNKSDDRFRDENTLLYDWMTLKPKDFINLFPNLKGKISVEDLQAVSDTWKPDGPTGKDALVYKFVNSIPKVFNVMDDKEYTPIIVVTEMTESQLKNYEFYKGSDADDKIEREIEDENNVMRAGNDGEYLVDPNSGDRVYRFVRTEFLEDNPVDRIIQGKITLSDYNKRTKRVVKEQSSPESILSGITGDDAI